MSDTIFVNEQWYGESTFIVFESYWFEHFNLLAIKRMRMTQMTFLIVLLKCHDV